MRSVLLSLCAVVASTAPVEAHAQVPAPCAVNVEFGSYAMGIDQAAFTRIDKLLKQDRGVRAVAVQRHGREGETALCIRVRKTSDMRRLYVRIRNLIPADPRGPITVTTRSGLRHTASKAF